ncbi:MAG: bifunctional folylpolyglutamate synthase/dihydrofolate synthase [Candidatus Saganbacteria bacterium]|nr:bifunctional folylpolyglutamate synthase/dihydrofolate synthase [Candidatus Saganbacteria bacterium]
MNYPAAIKYLRSLEKFGINLGLERVARLLDGLGGPQRKIKTLHVAGTNGKGSTCAMIASILKEAGYKVGLYTSPHLLSFNERIKINGRDISDDDFSQGVARIVREEKGLAGKEKPTVFEVLTALAFWYFAKEKVDYAVVEVGMGGRLDATNVITPLVSVITNVDLEHTAVLGKTLAKIAAEKSAIIKPGVPVVTAETKPEALRVMKYQAEKNHSLLVQVGSLGEGFKTSLPGEHQKLNAACAVAAVRLAGIQAGKASVLSGLKKVKWPGRFQVVNKRPLTILDGAHNPAGAKVLVETLEQRYPGRKFVFVFGVQKDKDAPPMLAQFGKIAEEIIITRSTNKAASGAVDGKKAVRLSTALELSAGRDRVITGSLYLLADALKCLDGAPAP